MRAKDVMTAPVVTAAPEMPVDEVARLLIKRNISALPVVDPEGRLTGIVSEGDLMRRPEAGTERRASWWLALLGDEDRQAIDYARSHGRHAADVMTREVVTVGEDASVGEIAALLEKHRIKRVPVVRDGKVVGIVSRSNLLQALAAWSPPAQPTEDDEALRQRLVDELARAGVDTRYVNVVAHGGVLHMWGTVRTDAQRRAATIAAQAAHPRAIEDNLAVLPRGFGSWE